MRNVFSLLQILNDHIVRNLEVYQRLRLLERPSLRKANFSFRFLICSIAFAESNPEESRRARIDISDYCTVLEQDGSLRLCQESCSSFVRTGQKSTPLYICGSASCKDVFWTSKPWSIPGFTHIFDNVLTTSLIVLAFTWQNLLHSVHCFVALGFTKSSINYVFARNV